MSERLLYKRPRIDAMLANTLKMPLTIVTATAGYGKTTAVRVYLQMKRIDQIWISVTADSEEYLWEKLCEGVAVYSAEKAAMLSALSVPRDHLQIARIIGFLKKNLKHSKVLVLDDFHLISQDSCLNALINALAFENLPGFHLVLITRSTPNIKLYTLTSRQLCNRIDTADLAFTREETAGYLAARGLRMAPAAIDKITEKTEGWVSAIYLIGEGIRHGLAIGNIRDISGLIRENLLDQLKLRQQEWLIRLSVFEFFSGDLAMAALDTSEILDFLETLVAKNAFLTNDDGLYRFHPLLRDVLLESVSDNEAQRAFYYRAGIWFEKNGANAEAFSFFDRSGRIEEFFARINQSGTRGIVYPGTDRLNKVVTELPEDVCLKYPFPYLQIIFFLMVSGNANYFETGKKLLGRIEANFAGSEAPDAGMIRGECLVIRRLGNFSPPECWNDMLKEAVREFNGRHSIVLSPEDPFNFGMPMLLHSEYLSAGSLDAVVERCSTNYFEIIANGFGRGSESLIQAEAALVRCHMREAENNARKAFSQAQESGQYYVAASARFVLMRAALFRGNAQEAQVQMDEIRSLSVQAAEKQLKNPGREHFVNLVECSEGFLNISLGQPRRIPTIFCRLSPMPQRMLKGMGLPLCLRAQAQLLFGNAAEVIGLCDALRHDTGQYTGQLVRLSIGVQRAAAEEILYPQKGVSETTLAKVLGEAQADHVLLPFAECARHLLPILKKVQKRPGVSTEFCRCVIDACEETLLHTSAWTGDPDDVKLSDREIMILQQAARGMTRKEIASKLFIQEDTVKKHLSSIYRKLNVDNKVSAIEAAKQCKLI